MSNRIAGKRSNIRNFEYELNIRPFLIRWPARGAKGKRQDSTHIYCRTAEEKDGMATHVPAVLLSKNPATYSV